MEENNIKNITVFLMIFIAICFDFGQAIAGWVPIIGNIFADIVSIYAFFTFVIWFYLNGIKMMTPKQFTSIMGAGAIEMFPYLNLFPTWTALVIYTIGTKKVQELAQKYPNLTSIMTATAITVKSMKKPTNSSQQNPRVEGV